MPPLSGESPPTAPPTADRSASPPYIEAEPGSCSRAERVEMIPEVRKELGHQDVLTAEVTDENKTVNEPVMNVT